jgi:hypothetical protein
MTNFLGDYFQAGPYVEAQSNAGFLWPHADAGQVIGLSYIDAVETACHAQVLGPPPINERPHAPNESTNNLLQYTTIFTNIYKTKHGRNKTNVTIMELRTTNVQARRYTSHSSFYISRPDALQVSWTQQHQTYSHSYRRCDTPVGYGHSTTSQSNYVVIITTRAQSAVLRGQRRRRSRCHASATTCRKHALSQASNDRPLTVEVHGPPTTTRHAPKFGAHETHGQPQCGL